jgi:hypothetical protein
MSIELLEEGNWSAYRTFYSLGRIAQASRFHARPSARIKHLGYAWAWKHLEHVWNAMIRSGGLALARPVIETGLDLTRPRRSARSPIVEQAEAAASTTPLTLEGAEVPEDTPSPQGRAA